MARIGNRKAHPIVVRLPEADIASLDRAAYLCGRSRSAFVREAAVRAAEEVHLEPGLIGMNPRGFAEFLAWVTARAMPVPEMVDLLTRQQS